MGLKTIPTVVQLPGGVKLQAMPFKIIGHDPETGMPTTFERLPAGTQGDFYFFASEDQLRLKRKK